VAESGTDDRFGNMERALWVLTAFRADPASSIERDWFGTEILRFVSADDAAMALGSLINGLLQTSWLLIDALAEELDRPGEEVIARLRRTIESHKGDSAIPPKDPNGPLSGTP
jgi:hypothetical protein